MELERDCVALLRTSWLARRTDLVATDYLLLAKQGGWYAARSRGGLPALVVPLLPGASRVGRRASGFELIAHSSIRFTYGGNEFDSPAAALVCTDPAVLDSFVILAADVARRADRDRGSWEAVVAAVEDWQTLLAPRGRLTIDAELGLWGELWFIAQSADVTRLLAGWRGPEQDSTDFFVAGIGAEVKTTSRNRSHHISQSQVDSPVGRYEAWLVSLWVKIDPAATQTVSSLVDTILARAPDPADALRRIARAGFSPSDRASFVSGFVILSEPEWYSVADVPRIRAMDEGISQLRYRIILDEARRADASVVERLCRHFQGNGAT